MNRGVIISGIGHLGLILWAVLGGWLFAAQSTPEIKVADVSLVSAAEFDAMTSSAPKVADQAPTPVAQPAPSQTAPVAPTTPDPVTTTPPPAPQPAPSTEAAPLPETVPVAPAPQPDPVPQPLAPPADVPQPIPVPSTDKKPKPRPVQKITDVPVDQQPDTTTHADQAAPKQTDAPAPVTPPEPPKPAATPDASAPTITPDAQPATDNAPQLAPTSSKRPQSRPKVAAVKPPDPVATDQAAADQAAADKTSKQAADQAAADKAAADKAAKAAADQAAADAAAVNAAVAAAATSAAAPSGPPMTSGEIDGLRVAVRKCWNMGTLSTAAMAVSVTLRVNVAQSGVPDMTSIRMTGSTGGDSAAATQVYEAARRAIIRCGKDGFPLPPDKYDTWKDLELTFDPSGVKK